MMCAVKAGHRIVALANLHPESPGELDSYMYQSVGSEGIHMIAEAMDLPLYRREIKGKPLNQDFDYSQSKLWGYGVQPTKYLEANSLVDVVLARADSVLLCKVLLMGSWTKKVINVFTGYKVT
ncbi:hypothetical protein ANCDUO_16443 [Ancylostoma duodenale]|uniref:Uncharacterized protein n=1 Tax=Ancylostoma duodenale TaxID=51022 RepID=A0A0C2CAX4_9BILA|nr:hypothetical protein ANCDUO_16443 [Ancylostoma duodenale]